VGHLIGLCRVVKDIGIKVTMVGIVQYYGRVNSSVGVVDGVMIYYCMNLRIYNKAIFIGPLDIV
jgi:hypothetical protein